MACKSLTDPLSAFIFCGECRPRKRRGNFIGGQRNTFDEKGSRDDDREQCANVSAPQ